MDTADLARKPYDIYNSRVTDSGWLDKSLELVSEDGYMVDMARGMTLPGAEGFKQFLLGWSTAFPDSQVEIVNLFATGDQAVVEFIGRGTHTGPLQGPAGAVPPTGKQIDIRFCDVQHWKNGKIVSIHTYYDSMTFLQQLGLIPPM